MKYYAVTDDPRELYHYGVKGMKWGQHIFGDKPKSSAYHRARNKLKASSASKPASAKVAKVSTISKAAQRDARRLEKQQAKFAKAVQKSQQRISMVSALHDLDQEDAYRKSLAREQKAAQIRAKLNEANDKRELKNLQKSIKSEKKLNKYMQQAREGTLRYGNLSEEQIKKVQDRLSMEDQARRLGGKEKQSWRAQKKEARRKGKLLGIERGRAAIAEEAARGAAQFGIMGLRNRMMMKSAAKHEGERLKAKERARNKKSDRELRKEIENDLHTEVMRAEIRDGVPTRTLSRVKERIENNEKSRSQMDAMRLKRIEDQRKEKKLEENRKQLADDLYKKYLMGGKNETYETMKERLEKKDEVRELIYGTSPGKKKTNKSKKPKTNNGPFENLKDGTVDVTHVDFANKNLMDILTPEDRAIIRGRRKHKK